MTKFNDTTAFEKSVLILSIFGMAALVGILLVLHWNWSLFMDDWVYHRLVTHPGAGNFITLVRGSIAKFLAIGRFVPAYAASIIILWKILPANPFAIHAFTLLLFFFLEFVAYRLLVSIFRPNSREKVIIIAWLGILSLAARPVLDTAAFVTIPEPWVLIFIILGFAQIRIRPVFSRVCFLVAVFYKEPAMAAFLATATSNFFSGTPERRKWAALDSTLFVILFLSINAYRKHAGSLADVSILSVDTIQNFAYGGLKVAIWGAAALLLGAVYGRKIWNAAKDSERSFLLFWLSFGVAYLGMTAVVPPAGYRLGPPAFSLVLAGVAAMVVASRNFEISRDFRLLLLTLAAATMFVSIARYERMNASINETAATINRFVESRARMTLVVQGSEEAGTVNALASDAGSPLHAIYAEPGKFPSQLDRPIVILESAPYFSKLTSNELATYEAEAGGWKKIEQGDGYRAFFGN